MTNETMPLKAFKLAMLIFNSDRQGINGSTLADFNQAEGRSLVAHGFLTEGEPSTLVPDRYSHDPLVGVPLVEPVWDEKTGNYQYYCRDESCWMEVADEDMKTYNLDVDRLMHHLRELLGLDGEPRVMRSKTLWNLGTFWLGSRKANVFLAREFSKIDVFDTVYDLLKRLGGKAPGLVVAWGIPQGRHMELPHSHRMLNLKQAVIPEGDAYRLDAEMIKGVLMGGQKPVDDLSPMRHSVDFSAVWVNGREFVFTGVKQQHLVGILVNAYKRGEPRCRTSEVLENVEVSMHANTLTKFFSGRSDWKELIGYGGGFCWLKV